MEIEEVPQKPKFREGVHIFPLNGKAIQVKSMHKDLVLEGKVAVELIPKLFSLANGQLDLFEITEKIIAQYPGMDPKIIKETFKVLNKNFLLEDGRLSLTSSLDEKAKELYGAQLNFFAYFSYNKYEVQEKLNKASVTLIGEGELKEQVVNLLNEFGIGEIKHKPIAIENNPDWNKLLTPADLVVVLLGRPLILLLEQINEVCLAKRIPWTKAVLSSFCGEIGPTVIPYRTACNECFNLRIKSTRRHYGEHQNYENFLKLKGSEVNYHSLPVFYRLLSNLLVIEILKLLTDVQPPLSLGTSLSFDFVNFDFQKHKVLKLPRCPVCGPETGVPLKAAYLKDWSDMAI